MDGPVPRDPKADLALCAAATPGRWSLKTIDAGTKFGPATFVVFKDLGDECGGDITIGGVRRDGTAVRKTDALLLMTGAWLLQAGPEDEANARLFAESKEAIGWYAERHQRLLDFIADFDPKTQGIPLGEKDPAKGASVYNWRSFFLRELKAALAEVDAGAPA